MCWEKNEINYVKIELLKFFLEVKLQFYMFQLFKGKGN